MLQSVIPAVYPILKQAYRLDFKQIGLITLSVQLTASLLQPFVGMYTDHRPTPYSLPVGMGFTLSGLLLLAYAPRFGMILVAVALVGVGSSVFHPESSRQRGVGAGPVAGRPGGASGRTTEHRVVLGGGAAGDHCIDAHRGLVQEARRGQGESRGGPARPPAATIAASNGCSAGGADGAGHSRDRFAGRCRLWSSRLRAPSPARPRVEVEAGRMMAAWIQTRTGRALETPLSWVSR